MTMCVINSMNVDGNALTVRKGTKTIDSAHLDDITSYSVTDFSLTEEFLKPNEFTFTLRRDALKKTDDFKQYKILKKILGKRVSCNVETRLGNQKNSEFTFEGTIVSASVKGMNINCVALSDDADLQGPPKSRCFTNIKLGDLAQSLLPAGSKVAIHSCFQNLEFPLIVQYNESDYDFLARLAQRFGLFFYHEHGGSTRNKIVFGKLPHVKNLDVLTISDPNASGISYEFKPDDPNIKFLSHYDEKGLDIVSDVADFKRNGNTAIFKMAAEASVNVANVDNGVDYPNVLPSKPVPSDDLMKSIDKAMVGSLSMGMVTCKFNCYVFSVGVGDVITVKDSNKMLVTSATLTWDCDGSPLSEITALVLPDDSTSDDDIFAPYMDIDTYPKSSAQRAVIFNNVDPKKMGRVQVLFGWQKAPANDQEKANLPWIRIAQPYGGNQKGCYLLPEIGDEVMVGFEHENMEKPFVIGTLYHDSDKDADKRMPDEAWVETAGDGKANEENEVKAFRTKKGHTIEFHDTKEGDGFIRIYGHEKQDQPNYDIILSTDPIKLGAKRDQVYQTKSSDETSETGKDVKEKEDYKVEKMRIMVRSNGGDIVLDAGDGDIVMNAKNIRIHATGNTTSLIDGKNIVKVKGDQLIDVDSSSLMVQKDQTIEVKGKEKEKYDKEVSIEVAEAVKMKAKSLESKTDQDTEINASNVKADASGSVKLTAKSGMDLSCDGSASLSGKSGLNLKSNSKAQLSGGTTVVEGTIKAELKSKVVQIEAQIEGTRKGMWRDQ